jgi:hypothetical protein
MSHLRAKYFHVQFGFPFGNLWKGSKVKRQHDFSELRLATLEMEQGHYLDITSLMALIPDPNRANLWAIVRDNNELFRVAPGSSHNHQAWEGGYIDHVTETMNIACQLYRTLNVRRLPFSLSAALEVMFLHDIEKPFAERLKAEERYTKAARKGFRADMIHQYGIRLTAEQENALRYVEGVPDCEYTPGERTMGELAAFVHCCDILSARLWHDKGKDVPAPAWE